jgi:ADP-heptose:LPS heptosyltransferase
MQTGKKYLLKILEKVLTNKKKKIPTNFKNILIIRQHDQLGDFLLSTPVFREIKKALPESKISVVLTPYTAIAAQNNPNIDEIIVYQPKVRLWNFFLFSQFFKQIRIKYDLCIVLNTPSHSLTSDLIAVFSGAHFILGMEPRKSGDDVQYDFFYDAITPREHPRIHQTRENLSLLGGLSIQYSDFGEQMILSAEEILLAQDQLSQIGIQPKSLILILPGAGKLGNRWPAESFISLGKQISGQGPLLILWGPRQEDIGEKILSGLKENGARTLRKTSIRQMAALASQSRLCICNDTGDLHVCAAVGAKTLALFGPTDPNIYLPIGKNIHSIKSPTPEMKDIRVQDVFNKVEILLSK